MIFRTSKITVSEAERPLSLILGTRSYFWTRWDSHEHFLMRRPERKRKIMKTRGGKFPNPLGHSFCDFGVALGSLTAHSEPKRKLNRLVWLVLGRSTTSGQIQIGPEIPKRDVLPQAVSLTCENHALNMLVFDTEYCQSEFTRSRVHSNCPIR